MPLLKSELRTYSNGVNLNSLGRCEYILRQGCGSTGRRVAVSGGALLDQKSKTEKIIKRIDEGGREFRGLSGGVVPRAAQM
jgi:hypothetical protein